MKSKKENNFFPGFQKLLIRDVPPGAILSSDNADSFPQKDIGSYISEDKLLMIQTEGDGLYRLIPCNDKAMMKFITKFDFVKGDAGFINSQVKVFYKK